MSESLLSSVAKNLDGESDDYGVVTREILKKHPFFSENALILAIRSGNTGKVMRSQRDRRRSGF